MKATISSSVSRDPLIQAQDLCVLIGDQVILDRISIQVEPTQIVALIGPNGAGKSTLVKALLGLIQIHSGTLKKTAGLRIGYMPQHVSFSHLMPLTVNRFLALGPKATPDKVADVLQELEITPLDNKPMDKISGGEMQRVLLGRTLMNDPHLLVLDEPVQGVDITGQLKLHRLIGDIRDRRGCGVVIVSHDLHLVMAGTDSVVCLNQHVCCSGHPSAVSQNPEFLKLFGTGLEQHFALYAHQHDHKHTLAGDVIPKDHPL